MSDQRYDSGAFVARKRSESWIEVAIGTPERHCDAACGVLARFSKVPPRLGPKGEDGLRPIKGALLDDGTAGDRLERLEEGLRCLEESVGAREAFAVELKRIEAPVWADGSPRPPVLVGPRLAIVTDSASEPLTDGRMVLHLEAGNAFGDGTHPSTLLSLRLLQALLDGGYGEVPGQGWMLDAGCGTGILAMAGAVLGGFRVLAVDISPEAVAAARRNLRRNPSVASRATLIRGDLTGCRGPFAVVAANLVAAVHVGVSSVLWEAVRPGGWLLLAGFSRAQKGLICQPFLERGAEERAALADGEWVGVLLRKPQGTP